MSIADYLEVHKPPVDLIKLSLNSFHEINLSVDWLLLLICLIIIFAIVKLIKRLIKKKSRKTVYLNGINFGVPNFSCSISCSSDVQEIAYKLWIEMVTRKIALPIEENDVISEIYDSWYSAFYSIRELLKTVPGYCLEDASNLIDLTTKDLNAGMRPHLTKWQATYRRWYDNAISQSDDPPQIVQTRFPDYDDLFQDLCETNQHMIRFAEKMKEIAFK